MEFNEEKLISIAKSYLSKARPGDWNHALRVVNWVKRLSQEGEDARLLIVAAYLHDVGWSGVWKGNKVELNKMLKLESTANKNTTIFVKKILSELNFSLSDQSTVTRLIKAADKHESSNDSEAIIVDADNLSKLSVNHVKEKYKPESYKKIIEKWEKEFPKRIKTKEGKKIYSHLLENLKAKLI
jgi:HD superfamily phosphodiesterase